MHTCTYVRTYTLTCSLLHRRRMASTGSDGSGMASTYNNTINSTAQYTSKPMGTHTDSHACPRAHTQIATHEHTLMQFLSNMEAVSMDPEATTMPGLSISFTCLSSWISWRFLTRKSTSGNKADRLLRTWWLLEWPQHCKFWSVSDC